VLAHSATIIWVFTTISWPASHYQQQELEPISQAPRCIMGRDQLAAQTFTTCQRGLTVRVCGCSGTTPKRQPPARGDRRFASSHIPRWNGSLSGPAVHIPNHSIAKRQIAALAGGLITFPSSKMADLEADC